MNHGALIFVTFAVGLIKEIKTNESGIQTNIYNYNSKSTKHCDTVKQRNLYPLIINAATVLLMFFVLFCVTDKSIEYFNILDDPTDRFFSLKMIFLS